MKYQKEYFTNLDAHCLNRQSIVGSDGSIIWMNQKIRDHGHCKRITQFLSSLLKTGSVGPVWSNKWEIGELSI
jgi:hypothetical protein